MWRLHQAFGACSIMWAAVCPLDVLAIGLSGCLPACQVSLSCGQALCTCLWPCVCAFVSLCLKGGLLPGTACLFLLHLCLCFCHSCSLFVCSPKGQVPVEPLVFCTLHLVGCSWQQQHWLCVCVCVAMCVACCCMFGITQSK